MEKGTLSKNILAYHTIEADREKLIVMFESMKTSSTNDRFQYIRQWHGTDEVEPINLASGLSQKTDPASDAEVLLATRDELKEAVEK